MPWGSFALGNFNQTETLKSLLLTFLFVCEQSFPVAFGLETAKWICAGSIDIEQLSVTGYLLWIGKPHYALALLALIIPQIYFQFQYFLKDPVKYDVDYQTSSLPFFLLGLLVTALATSQGSSA